MLTPSFKKRKQTSDVHKNTESDSTETNSLTKKETQKPKKQVQKTPAKNSAKKGSMSTKREGAEKSGNAKKKIKSDKSDAVSGTSLEDDDDEDDQESEDDVSEMLVPMTSGIPEERKVKKVAEEQKVPKPRKKPTSAKTPQKAKEPEPITDEDDDSSSSSDDDDDEDNVKVVEDAKAEDFERAERLKRLEQSIDAVIEESRLWYEEHFGDDSDDGKNNTADKSDRKFSGNGDDEEEDDGDDEGKKKRGQSAKRKKAWTSFLEINSKKKKVKLEKFEDEKDNDVARDDGESKVDYSSKSESLRVGNRPHEEDDKSLVKAEKEPETSVVDGSEKAKSKVEVVVPEKSEADAEDCSPSLDKTGRVEAKDSDSVEKKPLESVQTLKLMDAQTKLELAKKVSQYIMKGAFDKKDKKSSSDESTKSSSSANVSKISGGKDDSSDTKKENETVRRSSGDESKSAKDYKKTSGPSFNLKLMRPEDIASKREKVDNLILTANWLL